MSPDLVPAVMYVYCTLMATLLHVLLVSELHSLSPSRRGLSRVRRPAAC